MALHVHPVDLCLQAHTRLLAILDTKINGWTTSFSHTSECNIFNVRTVRHFGSNQICSRISWRMSAHIRCSFDSLQFHFVNTFPDCKWLLVNRFRQYYNDEESLWSRILFTWTAKQRNVVREVCVFFWAFSFRRLKSPATHRYSYKWRRRFCNCSEKCVCELFVSLHFNISLSICYRFAPFDVSKCLFSKK